MFLTEISGIKILYAGDYSREADRNLELAEITNKEINVLIAESTYGININMKIEMKEKKILLNM